MVSVVNTVVGGDISAVKRLHVRSGGFKKRVGTESIMMATALGNVEMVQCMLDNGVDPNCVKIFWHDSWFPNSSGKTKKIISDIERYFIPYSKGWSPALTPACLAAFYGHVDILYVLERAGSDLSFNPFSVLGLDYGVNPSWNPVLCALYGKKYDLADMLMNMGYVAPKENTNDAIYVRFKDCRGLSMANILLHNKIPKVCFDLCKSFILKRKF